jgi:hypothetical protein
MIKSTLISAFALLSTLALNANPKDMKELLPPVVTSDAGFYASAEGGVFFSDASKTFNGSYDTTSTKCCHTTTTAHSTHSSSGSDWGPLGGLNFGYNFSAIPVGFLSLSAQPGLQLEGLYKTNNNYDAWCGFANATLNIKNPSIVTPFVFVGGGFEYTSGVETGLHPAMDTGAGLNERISKNWSVYEEYKFIDAFADSQIQQHCVLVGVTHNF